MNTFYNQMFNPQYVNLQYYRQIEQLQYEAKQNEEVIYIDSNMAFGSSAIPSPTHTFPLHS